MIKNMKRIMIGALVLLTASIGLKVSATTDVSGKIVVKSSTYQKMDSQDDGTFAASTNTQLEPSQYISNVIAAELDNSDGSLAKGDTFTYTIDSHLQYAGINTENQNYTIYSEDGKTLIAEGIYNRETKVITFYFTKAAADSQKVTLNMNIPTSLDKKTTPYNGDYTFTNTLGSSSQSYTYTVYMDANSHNSRATVIQSNSLITDTNLSTNRYTMVSYIHRYSGSNSPMKFEYSSFTTTINGQSVTLSPESNAIFKIYKPNAGYNLPDSYGVDISQMTDVTAEFTQSKTGEGYSSFVGTQPFEIGDDYVVVLENDINPEAAGYIYSALKSGSVQDGLVWNSSTSTVIDRTKGDGTLQNPSYSIQIKKADENGTVLAGAVFDVYRLSTGEKVATVTTDANGLATVTGLFATIYEVKEVTAPVGYVLDTTSRVVLASDFDSTSKTATVTVTNKASTIDIAGVKVWDDANDAAKKRPTTITVNLLADGVQVASQAVSADASGNWNFSFTNLPEYKNGQKIVYTLTENAVEGYQSNVSGYTITNTYVPTTPPMTTTPPTPPSAPKEPSTQKVLPRTNSVINSSWIVLGGILFLAALVLKKKAEK